MTTEEDVALRVALSEAIKAHPAYSATSLARAIGRDGTYIRDFLRGKKDTLGAREIVELEGLLGVQLQQRALNDARQKPSGSVSNFRPPPIFLGDRDLPVYSAAEGGPGEMVISPDPVQIVPRPWFMNEVKDGYAVLITGESMVPAYRPGEMAIVNPRLPPTRNQDTIFTAKREDRGEFRATIKHLLRWSTKEWLVEQYNPPEGQAREFILEKAIWGEALRVVGKYNR